MTENWTTKANLLAEIAHGWSALNGTFDHLTEPQMTMLHDTQGWTVKDHIIHLSSWERSVVFFLQNKPRHVGLGVEEALYLNGTADGINDAIFQQSLDISLAEALAQWRDGHEELLKLIQPLTDADLQKPYRRYLPDESGEGDGPTAYDLIFGNTAGHFADHRGWIAKLLGNID